MEFIIGLLCTIGLFLLAIAVFWLMRFLLSQSDAEWFVIAKWFSIFFAVILAVAALVYVPLQWVLIAAAIFGMVYHRHVAAKQDGAIGLLAAAVERKIPLALAFAAIGAEREVTTAERARGVSRLLSGGMPIPDAMAAEPSLVPPEALPLVSVGCAGGSLGPALRQVLAARAATSMIWQSIAGRAAYLLYLPVFFVGIIGFVLIVVFPIFEKIYKDFGMKLPDVTMMLYGLARQRELVVPICLFVWAVSWILFCYTLLRFSGVLRLDLPGMGWFTRRLDRATVLDALSLAARDRRPLPETIGLLADWHPKRAVCRRLEAALGGINQGRDGLECLRRYDLLGAVDVAVLKAAVRNGNFAWAAHEMADSNRRRFQYRTFALMQTVFPAVIIAMASFAMFFVVALFMPLLNLLTQMAR